MAKQQIHLNLSELRNIIREQIHESYLGKYGMSGTCEFEPGWNADITEEEAEELNQYMHPKYYVSFNTESSGGDGYYTPDETYNVPDEADIEAVRADINNIPNEHLRQAITDEFETWLNNCDPDMVYNEPDPDRYRDEMYEDSGYGVDKYGKVNESKIKSYFKSLIREALQGINGQQFVIQTRTGGYLMDVEAEHSIPDEDEFVLFAKVGKTPVRIRTTKKDYLSLLSNGNAFKARYQTIDEKGDSIPEQPCIVSFYNA